MMTLTNPKLTAASLACLILLLAGCTTTTNGDSTTLTAELAGTAAGDSDGSGSATITVDEEGGEVCWELSVEGIDNVTAAHIHRGEEGTDGPVAVGLSAPTNGESDGCTDAEADVIAEILENPSAFYVNVHNDEFPGGAVRGQLTE